MLVLSTNINAQIMELTKEQIEAMAKAVPAAKTETPVSPVPAETSQLFANAIKHLAQLRENIKHYIGKPDCNPFIYERDVLKPLESSMKEGSVDACNKILAINLNTKPEI